MPVCFLHLSPPPLSDLYRVNHVCKPRVCTGAYIYLAYAHLLTSSEYTDECTIDAPLDEDDSPAKNGLVTFLAFVIFGVIPLLPFVLGAATKASDEVNFAVACALTGLTMLALGASKAKFTNQSMSKSALLMLLNGGMAAVAAYLVSWGIATALGNKGDGMHA